VETQRLGLTTLMGDLNLMTFFTKFVLKLIKTMSEKRCSVRMNGPNCDFLNSLLLIHYSPHTLSHFSMKKNILSKIIVNTSSTLRSCSIQRAFFSLLWYCHNSFLSQLQINFLPATVAQKWPLHYSSLSSQTLLHFVFISIVKEQMAS